MLYPKYKYHKELPPVVVESLEHEDSLEGDWRDSPADHLVEAEQETGNKEQQDSAPTPKTKRAKAK